jgi:hypothetical protein
MGPIRFGKFFGHGAGRHGGGRDFFEAYIADGLPSCVRARGRPSLQTQDAGLKARRYKGLAQF